MSNAEGQDIYALLAFHPRIRALMMLSTTQRDRTSMRYWHPG